MRQIEPGLVAFHDIRQRNGFLQPRRPHGALYLKKLQNSSRTPIWNFLDGPYDNAGRPIIAINVKRTVIYGAAAAYQPRTIAVRPVLAGIRLCAKSPGCTLYGSLVSGYLVGSSYY